MKFFFTPRENWWRTAVFLLWITALSFLLLSQTYTIFLRPEFGILLGIGILTLAGFLFSDWVISKPRPLGPLGILRCCILLLPLAYMLNSGDRLDSFAFQNRFLGPASTATDTAVELSVETGGLSAPKQSAPVPGLPTGEVKDVTLLDITRHSQQYMGKPVSVVGMLAQSEKVDKFMGEKSLLLFRFVVNCCAADSTPVYVLIQGSSLPDFPKDTWVKVQGVLGIKNKDQYRIPVIYHAVLEETKAPKIPYLF